METKISLRDNKGIEIGHLNYVIKKDEIEATDFVIENKKYRNKGYGQAMLDELMKIAIENNSKRIYGIIADVDINNLELLKHLYKKYGFVITENKKDPQKPYKIADVEKIL